MKKQKLFRSIGSVQEPLYFPLNDDDEEEEDEDDDDDENERDDDYNDDNYMSDDDENDERGHDIHVPYNKILLWNH